MLAHRPLGDTEPDIEAEPEHEGRNQVEEGGLDHQARDPFLRACNWSLVARLIAGKKREKQAPATKTGLKPSSLCEPNSCTRNSCSVTDIDVARVQVSVFLWMRSATNLD